MKKVILLTYGVISCILLRGQVWNGKNSAVVLTYDDALNVHLDNAIPLLDSLGLKATFYLSGYFPGCRERLNDWKKAAARGHELGNHTLFHPCIGNQPGREWVSRDYDMSTYTTRRMVDETKMNNVLLEALDGKTERTFAYTCGDMKVGDSVFMPHLYSDFVAARAVRHETHPIDKVDIYSIDCYAINGQSAEYMIDLVKKSMQAKHLLVFLFHGVGGEHALNVSLPAHRQLLNFLKQHERSIWIAPMVDIARYIKAAQAHKK